MEENNLKLGLIGQAIINVTEENTAMKFGSGSVKVFATPAMVGLMEKAAINAVDNLLPDGFATVGTHIDVRHLSATPLGMIIIAKAELIEIDGKKLKFKIEAFDEIEKIGEGIHSRYIIKLQDFLERTNKKLEKMEEKKISK
ncbi:MAG: thioesterase family protein [Actinobacteria bacterium]|nr:thioesterase family protein [Cyanobacteriota bacterium]MCL5772478.1 thioesterase family protein [Actinomycetota bacterium]